MIESPKYNRIGVAEARSMECVLRDLLESVNSASAIASVIERGERDGSTMFERYASQLLEEAGGYRLLNLPSARRLRLLRPDNGSLAHFASAKDFPQTIEATLLGVECAINRLIGISDAVSDGMRDVESPKKEPRRSISILGGGYLSDEIGWRSSRVKLPSLDSISDVSIDFYNEIDWRSTDCVANNARAVLQQCVRPNAYRTTLGTHVADQSDWDVRTRAAQLFNALELPYRNSYRYDYDSDTSTLVVFFTCPPTSFLPAITNILSNEESLAESRAYASYIIKFASLFAAACFGSGRNIQRAISIGYDAAWSNALVSLEIGRVQFANSVLAAIDSSEFSKPELRFEPEQLALLIEASHLDWRGRLMSNGADTVFLPEIEVPSRSIEPWRDTRTLPQEAHDLFHCKRISDVDTSHYLGGNADAIDLAREDADESSLSAIARLEALVEELEWGLEAPDDDIQAHPLFAPHPLARLAVSLVEDEKTIAAQAEAFLEGASDDKPLEHVASTRYFRAPSALFYARFGLSDLYQTIGDFTAAELQADRCVFLAPTTAGAYYRKADILAEQGRHTEAANVLIAGLRCCVASVDCALLYYHLAMLLWNIGMQWESATIHVYNTSLKSDYADRSKQVINGLRKQPDAPAIVNSPPLEAMRELERLHFPVAPVNIRHQIAQATILLANAGSPRAAAPFAHEFERLYGSDEVVKTACRSIQYGVQSA